MDKAQGEKVPWDLWAQQGYLTTIEGPFIQAEVIAMAVAAVAEECNLQLLAYDRWRIADFKRERIISARKFRCSHSGRGLRI